MANKPTLIGAYKNGFVRLKPGHATRPRLIFQAGENGARLHALSAVHTAAGANTVLLYAGERLTQQANMGTGTLVDGAGSSDTLTRTGVNSFVADKWAVEDLMLVRGATTLANDFLVPLTAVAALTLTFATGTVAGSNEVLPAGAELWRLTQLNRSTLAANAGNAAGTKALDLLTADKDMIDAAPDRFMTLGPNVGLFAAVGTTLSSAIVDISAFYGDY